MAEGILILQDEQNCYIKLVQIEHAYKHMIISLLHTTYNVGNKPRPLYACRLDGLEEVDHTLSFQSLQLSMDTDECASTTNTVTAGAKRVHVLYSRLHFIVTQSMCVARLFLNK